MTYRDNSNFKEIKELTALTIMDDNGRPLFKISHYSGDEHISIVKLNLDSPLEEVEQDFKADNLLLIK